MSFWDDLERFMGHLAHGDLGGALGDAGQAVHDVVGGAPASTDPQRQAAAAEQAAMQAKMAAEELNRAKRGGGTVVPPPPAMTVSTPACCDRFTFNGGFLVDGATGSVWLFNQTTNTFDEVRVVRSSTKQTLVDTMVENKLSRLRNQYELEVLGTVAPAQRATKLADFEKTYLDPLRNAAKELMY